MHQRDFDGFADRLSALAETLGKPVPTGRALAVWFDTLKAFPTDQVLGLIADWPRLSSRFPAPADVWAKLNDVSIEKREKRAACEAAMHTLEHQQFVRSDLGRRILAQMSEMLAKRKPMSAYTIARDIVDRIVDGAVPSVAQLAYVTDFADMPPDQLAELIAIGTRNRNAAQQQPDIEPAAVAEDSPW
jgi:hypothetical protein